MPTAENGLIQVEQGQTLVPFAAMSDSGDQKVFTAASMVFSGRSGKEPDVRPNGIVTGRDSLTPDTVNDKVAIAAFSAYSKGTLHSVAVTTATIARPLSDVSKVNSITMDDTGAIAVVEGTSGSDTSFSETRGAAGGPPEIPADSVEIGQVRVTASAAGLVSEAEIFQVVGAHSERYDFPVWTVDNLGQGEAAEEVALENAHVRFVAELPSIHSGGTPKGVYVQYYTPIFADQQKALDFKPAETSHSVSSTQIYGGSVGSSSESLGQGGFTALLTDGIMDSLVKEKNQVLTVKYFPDRNRAPYVLTQGKIGLSRTFPVGDQIQAAVTISAERASAEFSS